MKLPCFPFSLQGDLQSPCDAFILKGRAPQAEVCVNSAYRKVKGVTASVTERKLIWDFLTWVSQAGAAKQSQSGVCAACLSAAERVVCVSGDTMSKTECKAAEDMTEAVSLFHVTYVSCKKHNPGRQTSV